MTYKLTRSFASVLASVITLSVTFMMLVIVTDAGARVYYETAPLRKWVDFIGVTVIDSDRGPTMVVHHQTNDVFQATFHRSLLVLETGEQLCDKSQSIIVDPDPDGLSVMPLQRALSEDCVFWIDGRKLRARLHVTLAVNLPYGVERFQSRDSNYFDIWIGTDNRMVIDISP